MNRIEAKFAELKSKKEKALLGFITAGDPSLRSSIDFALSLAAGGVDILELGMPFSDPMADGPTIQKANERALKAGMTIARVLDMVAKVRKKSKIPILLMGYLNPILKFGLSAFVKKAAGKGVDALLIVDLPPEEAGELKKLCESYGLSLIFLLAPTSHKKRIQIVSKCASGFIYFVSLTGITGATLKSKKEAIGLIPHIKRLSKLPVVVGFGIKNSEMASSFSKVSDGVVVGSAFIQILDSLPPKKASIALKRLASKFKEAMKNNKK